MIVLGIDPGLRITGFGVVEQEGDKLTLLHSGKITTAAKAKETLSERLKIIYDHIEQVVVEYPPHAMAIENIFYGVNVQSAFKLAHARGVAIVAAANKGVPVAEYTPLQVKQAVVGYGRADKNQVKEMVQLLFRLKDEKKSFDIYDAIAVAVCHCHSAKLGKILYDCKN